MAATPRRTVRLPPSRSGVAAHGIGWRGGWRQGAPPAPPSAGEGPAAGCYPETKTGAGAGAGAGAEAATGAGNPGNPAGRNRYDAEERRAAFRDGGLIAAIILVTAAALIGGYVASRGLVTQVVEAHALQVAQTFTVRLAQALEVFDSVGRFVGIVGEEHKAVERYARSAAHIDRIVVIGLDRVVAFDSDDRKTGIFYDQPYITAALERGLSTVQIAASVDRHAPHVAEAYVPVRYGDRPVGVFELYLDVSDYVATVEDVFELAYGSFGIAVVIATAVALALVHASARRRRRDFHRICLLHHAAEEASRRLERSLDQQKRFTANAAHELRTPIAVLRARLEGAESTPATLALRTDAERMGHLVEQLLLVARLEAGMIALEDGVDLVTVARDTVARVFPLALADGKTIGLDAPAAPVCIRANGFALEDALRNLIDNALRHSPVGGVVEVAVTASPPALEVRDRGPGLPAGLRATLFEPFVHSRDRRGSAGLGLAIVAETAALHGGTVHAADRSGGGAVFRLVLPDPPAVSLRQLVTPGHVSPLRDAV